ncbi:hypothetical protein Fleli_0977 [Bernardetia litoralis DSM 6794]|uniref:Lipoprotein n=1 Tax=Bernardetia litoralis (strain ATCC 23117 / DSM 6794 / NBRC 15988 / NCIMB 1366 / Fx l1 / Sio-4) TaxID=880071 RepID=I4AHJ1_BERLS|nr:hypothetical protein [Bernardetia litoralis]AFM03426.1 hypothetical protein Fleli_0977 [Bernardetia litoralis DSM 6794]
MKKLIFSVFVLLIFLCAKCEDDTPKNPIDLLPPATQTGANTFGCLVDGEAFTPDNRPNSFDHSYVYSDGGYYLYISGSRTNPNGVISPAIGTEKLSILEGETYFLINRQKGSAYGAWYRSSNSSYTSTEYSGELYINKHDFANKIISGTFWYDIKDAFGDVHQIREGRFDIRY